MTKIVVAVVVVVVFVVIIIACQWRCWRCINKISAHTKSFALSGNQPFTLLIPCHRPQYQVLQLCYQLANTQRAFIQQAGGKHTFTTWLQRNYEWKIMIIIVAALLLCEVRMFDPYPCHATLHTLTHSLWDVIHISKCVEVFEIGVRALSTIHNGFSMVKWLLEAYDGEQRRARTVGTYCKRASHLSIIRFPMLYPLSLFIFFFFVLSSSIECVLVFEGGSHFDFCQMNAHKTFIGNFNVLFFPAGAAAASSSLI